MIFQFKIQLQGITKPPVWRRILVPGSFTFEKFHSVIQASFGWQDSHLYEFSPSGYGSNPRIGIPDEFEWENDPGIDSSKIELSEIFYEKGQQFTYIYDFGDDWVHKITLEAVSLGSAKKAELLAGKSACPPEDCGGPWGYQEMKAILSDPEHEGYESMRGWLGLGEEDEQWDPKYFDLAESQSDLAEW